MPNPLAATRRIHATRWRTTLAGLAATLALATVGCNYILEGKVVQGGQGMMVVADSDNPNLEQRGLSDVAIELTLDPGSISPRSLGTQLTDASGQFRFPIDATGAGLLEYELGVLCRRKDFKTLYQAMSIPPKNRRLLIVMTPGSGAAAVEEDVISETLRLGGQRDPR